MQKKTVFITGASTGIGLETALYFQQHGWNVAATMRSPEKASPRLKKANVMIIRLDVTDLESIKHAFAEALDGFGQIDAVVNNAGYGLSGPFEGATEAQIKRQFDTNVFGLMNVTREILPYFRHQQKGRIINIASMGGRLTFPYYSLYHSTKWAVEGFSESLHYELKPLGIRVKIIEPGATLTDFSDRSNDSTIHQAPTDYQELCEVGFKNMANSANQGSKPEKIAKAIFKAATDNSSRLRYLVGFDGQALMTLRHLIPNTWFFAFVRAVVFKR